MKYIHPYSIHSTYLPTECHVVTDQIQVTVIHSHTIRSEYVQYLLDDSWSSCFDPECRQNSPNIVALYPIDVNEIQVSHRLQIHSFSKNRIRTPSFVILIFFKNYVFFKRTTLTILAFCIPLISWIMVFYRVFLTRLVISIFFEFRGNLIMILI